MLDQQIEKIRFALTTQGSHSHTSQEFQDDLLFYAHKFAGHGNCLIEVGCFRGGMTAQFAYVARKFGQGLEVIDINADYLKLAREAVSLAGSDTLVNYHHCDLAAFVATSGSQIRPTLVLIDGDHRYDGVSADIRALYKMKTRPFAAAFHDFSLRYITPELASVRVDKALVDAFGPDFPHVKIGEIAGIGKTLRTVPSADGHYHEIGKPEGVLIICKNASLISRESD